MDGKYAIMAEGPFNDGPHGGPGPAIPGWEEGTDGPEVKVGFQNILLWVASTFGADPDDTYM